MCSSDLFPSHDRAGADGLDQEEIRFGKFINRLRSIFQDILVKPLWVQFCLDHPEMKKDYLLKSEFGLDYVKENQFTKQKEIELLTARKDQVIKNVLSTYIRNR